MDNSEFTDLSSNIYGDRYQVERILVDKNVKKTLLARDIKAENFVIIKLLIFNDSFSWDKLRLFEREAQTLKALSHPAIPQYLDYLEIDTEDLKGFAIVQSYIETPSLKEQIQSGRVFNEAEVKELARSILEILEYLHSHQPVIVHRDIKPSNILLGDRAGNSIGQIHLIDFGSVQNIAANNSSTITVVGTYGYMPPEQFGGRVRAASDLYSLGATLIYLVTGEHPADLPETDLRIEFGEFCNLSPGFVEWLKQMTNPSVNSRIASATQALEKLAECENYQGGETRRFVRPANSNIYLAKDRDTLEIIMPSNNYSGEDRINVVAMMLFCLLPWITALLALAMGISIEEILAQLFRYLVILAISTLAAAGLGYKLFEPLLTSKKLKIDRTTATLQNRLFGCDRNYIFIRSRDSLNKIEKNTVERSDSVYSRLNIYFEGNDKFELIDTDDYPVTHHEANWIAEELNIWLNIPMVETSVDERIVQQTSSYLRKAYKLHNTAKYEQAVGLYSSIIEFNPKSYDAYLNRAICYLEIQDYQGVVEDCYLALDLNPESAEAYCTRGAAFYFLADPDSAKKDLNLALSLNSEYPQAYYYLAAVDLDLKNYQAAIEYCDRALEINEKYSYAYLIKAQAYLGFNDFQATIDNCDRALELNNRLLEAYSVRGFAHCYSGDGRNALFNFYRVSLIKSSATNLYNLAMIEFTQEMYADALKSCDRCLRLDDKFKFAYYARANIYYELEYLELAQEDYNRATELEDSSRRRTTFVR